MSGIEQLLEELVRRVVREELAKRDGAPLVDDDDIARRAAERAADIRRRGGGR